MDNKLLLTKCITLLYRESMIPERSDSSADQVRTVLEQMKLPEVDLSVNRDRDTLVALKQSALEMCENDKDHIYEKTELLQRLKLNCQDDTLLYDSFAAGIDPEMSPAGVKNSVIAMRKSLQNHFRDQKTAEVLKKASSDFQFKREGIKNVKQWIGEIIAQLEPFQIDPNLRDPAIIREVDLSDAVGVAAAFNDVKDMDNGKGILRTGWQDINDMFQGGIRDSDTVCVGALQHKYKTGFSLTLFKQFCLYNTPILKDPTKKPLLLRISFEDTIEMNLQFLYQSLIENETGQKALIKGKSGEEIGRYVYERLQATGFHVKLLEVDPTKWSYIQLCSYILDLEAQGYEIKLLMVDYLNMLPKTGCTQGAMGDDIRDLFRRVRNFLKPFPPIKFLPLMMWLEYPSERGVRNGTFEKENTR